MKMQFNKDHSRLVVLFTNAERIDFDHGKIPMDETPGAECGRAMAKNIQTEYHRLQIDWPKSIEIRIFVEHGS